MDKTQLVKLCSRRWSLTALGLMAGGICGRVSPLAEAAGCGRTAMRASVAYLLEIGLLERNPGYGHPLRPEFRLTANGNKIAPWAFELDSLMASDQDRELIRTKWSLPLLGCMPGQTRFSDLRRQLQPVTDRALSNCLLKLTERRWVNRLVSDASSPPAVSYCVIADGLNVHRHLLQLPNVGG